MVADTDLQRSSQLGFIRLTVRFDGCGLATCGCRVQLVVMSAALRGSVSRFRWRQTAPFRFGLPCRFVPQKKGRQANEQQHALHGASTAGLAFEGSPSSLLVISDQMRNLATACHKPPLHAEPINEGVCGIQRRSRVQMHRHWHVWQRRSVVEVDDVANLHHASDNCCVSCLSPQQEHHAGFGGVMLTSRPQRSTIQSCRSKGSL